MAVRLIGSCYNIYCIIYIVYCLQYNLYPIRHTAYSLLCIVNCILYTVKSILHTVHHVRHTPLYTVQWKVYTMYSTLNCRLYSVHHVRPAPLYTVQWTVYTMYSTLNCTMYSVGWSVIWDRGQSTSITKVETLKTPHTLKCWNKCYWSLSLHKYPYERTHEGEVQPLLKDPPANKTHPLVTATIVLNYIWCPIFLPTFPIF